jgi:hypothetical protein
MSKSKSGVPVRVIPSGVRVNGAALEAAGARVNYGITDGFVVAPMTDAERDAILSDLESAFGARRVTRRARGA